MLCPNCNSPLVPARLRRLPSTSSTGLSRCQCLACGCTLEDTRGPDPFIRKLFLVLSVIMALSILLTLTVGSSLITDITLTMMVAALIIALPLCAIRWLYRNLFEIRAEQRYRLLETADIHQPKSADDPAKAAF